MSSSSSPSPSLPHSSSSSSSSAPATNSQFKCERNGCDALSSFRCPTCTKLGIPDSYYCSQSCFQRNWKNHKKIHTLFVTMCEEEAKKYDRLGGMYNPWPNYTFTGKLRPYPPVERRTVSERIARPDYADDVNGKPISEIAARNSNTIRVLNASEIEKMRTVCRLGREVLDEAAKAIRVGVTTAEIDRIVYEACMERNCYPSPLNYYTFPASCCTSVNEVICHGIPDQRPLEDGDLCNVDITVYFDGFHGDLNETFLVGNVSEPHRKLVNVTHECLTKAIGIVKPGVRYREIGNVIQRHAQLQGFQVVRSYCGHGIHQLFHTAPNVPHYAKNNAVGVMKEGHCFTIEPMISEGTWRDQKWPDNWTAVTTDGSWSAQFEHTLLVTATGCEVLTKRRTTSGLPHFLDSSSNV